MPGGAIWTILASTAAGVIAQAARAEAIDQALNDTTSTSGPYRPAVWQNTPLTSVTLTTTSSVSTSQAPTNTAFGSSVPGASSNTTDTTTDVFVFDAVIRTEHQQRIEKTEHPIQTGANVSDHAFIIPARVELQIGMSDAMDSYIVGSFSDNPSKSVSAYQTMVALAKGRTPVTVTTRLAVYNNMLLTLVSAPDTVETRFGLKATLVFEELFTGTIATQQVSARPDITDTTNIGTKQPLPAPSDISRFLKLIPTTVPDAGELSSNGS